MQLFVDFLEATNALAQMIIAYMLISRIAPASQCWLASISNRFSRPTKVSRNWKVSVFTSSHNKFDDDDDDDDDVAPAAGIELVMYCR